MVLDSFCAIGKSHKICQDYIVHGDNPAPYIILGDGCSSSENTDVGSRILVQSALGAIKDRALYSNSFNLAEFLSETIIKSRIVKDILKISGNCLDSTLVLLNVNNDTGTVRITFAGDGILVLKSKEIIKMKISYQGEMPYYLSYQLNGHRQQSYENMAMKLDLCGRIKSVEGDGKTYQVPWHDLTVREYSPDGYEFIIISSDGLDSFYKQETGERIPLDDVVAELCSFKSFKGEFLKRRMKRMLINYEKQGIFHYDDLSVGIIYNDNIPQ